MFKLWEVSGDLNWFSNVPKFYLNHESRRCLLWTKPNNSSQFIRANQNLYSIIGMGLKINLFAK